MNQTGIFLPMLALVSWTLLILLCLPYQRLKAIRAGTVSMDDFKFGDSAAVPDAARTANRNYMNLLEAPVLFYVVCILYFLTLKVEALTVSLAWSYVTLRIALSLFQLTYNNVLHRLIAFAVSNVLLSMLVLKLFTELR